MKPPRVGADIEKWRINTSKILSLKPPRETEDVKKWRISVSRAAGLNPPKGREIYLWRQKVTEVI